MKLVLYLTKYGFARRWFDNTVLDTDTERLVVYVRVAISFQNGTNVVEMCSFMGPVPIDNF
jgi:hypothetical protein